jgi:hypothetical protein
MFDKMTKLENAKADRCEFFLLIFTLYNSMMPEAEYVHDNNNYLWLCVRDVRDEGTSVIISIGQKITMGNNQESGQSTGDNAQSDLISSDRNGSDVNHDKTGVRDEIVIQTKNPDN